MRLSPKQKEFWNNANHRWNIKSGATRSGKTHLDYFLIPRRIRATKGQGLIVILGNTRGTLERNILDPMRQIYGNKLVGNISSDNTVILFGKKAYALGADKRNQVARIQGAGIEYCYGDEITTWSEEVFQMLKSRLDKPNSCFDGTCNPDHPNHWFKEFLDSDADIYHQHYTIDDNPFLDPFFVEQLKKEYTGTIYYDRFILGKWTRAEGVIYRLFADEPERYEISTKEAQEKLYQEITVGIDFGGNKSKHAFVATGILPKYKGIVVLASERHDTNVTPTELDKLFTDFLKRIIDTYGSVDYVYPDSAEQVLIRGFRAAAQKERLNVIIRDAKKIEIVDRIRLVSALISQGRFFYTKDAYTVRDALTEAVWDESKNEDIRLDNGTSDIDTLDALEYSIERDARRFMRMR